MEYLRNFISTQQNLLILLPHTESTDNASKINSGRRNPDLTPKGCEDAKQIGKLLGMLGITLGTVFTSTLNRSIKTADIVVENIQQDEQPAVFADSRLVERDYGLLTGGKKSDRKYHSAYWEDAYARYHFPPPDSEGESVVDVEERVEPVLEGILQSQSSTMVVTHGNTTRALMNLLSKKDGEDHAVRISKMGMQNTLFFFLLNNCSPKFIAEINLDEFLQGHLQNS